MTITKDMGIMEIVQNCPNAVNVFRSFGLGCVGCMAAHFETLAEGAGAHGIDVDQLVTALNDSMKAE